MARVVRRKITCFNMSNRSSVAILASTGVSGEAQTSHLSDAELGNAKAEVELAATSTKDVSAKVTVATCSCACASSAEAK